MIKIDEKVKGDKYLEMEGVSAITKATKLFFERKATHVQATTTITRHAFFYLTLLKNFFHR
jgi:hypothetical protein